MTKINFLTQPEVDEFCKYVCYQLQTSGSKKSDIETLYFAVYWQMCCVLEQEVEVVAESDLKINKFRQMIQTLTARLLDESYDILKIIDRNILECIDRHYLTADFR